MLRSLGDQPGTGFSKVPVNILPGMKDLNDFQLFPLLAVKDDVTGHSHAADFARELRARSAGLGIFGKRPEGFF